MKTYFVEIVFNNEDKYINKCQFLRCYVQAKDKEQASQKALDHYRPHYTAGDKGEFKVQCCWVVNVPTREIFEKYWKVVTNSYFPAPVTAGDFEVIGYRKSYLDETKKDVMSTWDACNAEWASPAVHYEPTKGGYMVQIHNYMNMPADFKFFKGSSKAVHDKAKKWVKENTFKGEYFRELV